MAEIRAFFEFMEIMEFMEAKKRGKNEFMEGCGRPFFQMLRGFSAFSYEKA